MIFLKQTDTCVQMVRIWWHTLLWSILVTFLKQKVVSPNGSNLVTYFILVYTNDIFIKEKLCVKMVHIWWHILFWSIGVTYHTTMFFNGEKESYDFPHYLSQQSSYSISYPLDTVTTIVTMDLLFSSPRHNLFSSSDTIDYGTVTRQWRVKR